MVRRASHGHGIFLEHPQRRRRLARVEDRDASVGRIDEGACTRRDAAETLEQVERGPFGDEQRSREADHLADVVARRRRHRRPDT
ncbi:MAG: hypothetical protein QM736_12990 [Vicinamibacterales bacterium]